jgi:hypothetical protein
MSFSFTGRQLPMSLRVCRSLLWAQVAYTVATGVFVLLITSLLGGAAALPFHDATLSGRGAVGLGVVYVIAAAALGWLAVQLGQLKQWARPSIVSLQVFLVIVQLFRAFDLSLATVVNVALVVAIVALLFVPDTERALAGAAQA